MSANQELEREMYTEQFVRELADALKWALEQVEDELDLDAQLAKEEALSLVERANRLPRAASQII